MSQQSEKEVEMGLDDFTQPIEAPKVVGKIEPEQVEKRVGVKNASGTYGNTQMSPDLIENLDNQVEDVIKIIVSSAAHSNEMKEIAETLNSLGNADMNKSASISSNFLTRRSLREMKGDTEGGGADVAKGLSELRQKMESLNPNKRKGVFEKSSKLLGFLPFGIGKKADNYFKEFQTAGEQLDSIMTSLYVGKDRLIEDNASIDFDRKKLYKLMQSLEQYAYILQKIDEKVEERLPEIEVENKIKAEDIKQEILFPLRQKRTDILNQLAVSFQGYLALQVAKQNNVELINSVNRTTNVTMEALKVAVILSEVLSSQKLVLNSIKEVNEFGNNLIASNSQMLGDNAAMIQQQASESAINADVLSKAFENTFKAMDQMDKYRLEALPKLQKTITNLQDTINGAKRYMETKRQENVSDFAKELSQPTENEDSSGAVKIKLSK